MTTAADEEVPFPTGMERESEGQKLGAQGAKLIKDIFRIDGVAEGSGDLIDQAHSMLKRLKEKVTVVEARADEALKSDGYEDPDEDAPPVPPVIAISGGGDFRPKAAWTRRRNSIIDGLLIAGIIALVSTSIYLLKTTVRLDTQYTERGQLYDERFGVINRDNARQDTEIGRHDERLNRLEQQRRDAQFNADNQQGNR